MGWPVKLYNTEDVVRRSDVIVVAHVEADSLKRIPGKGSYQHSVNLIVARILKGEVEERILPTPIMIHYGLLPVPAGYEKELSSDGIYSSKVMPPVDARKPIWIYEDNPSEGPGRRSGDVRSDQIWLLRQSRSYPAKDDPEIATTDRLGVWEPEDIQPLSKEAEIKKKVGQLDRTHVTESSNPSVDELVTRLVSLEPARFPNGYVLNLKNLRQVMGDESRVSKTQEELIKMGPSIFPDLIAHLRDDRYSWTENDSVTTWNVTVGDVVSEILADGLGQTYAYKKGLRRSSTGVLLDMPMPINYINERGPKAWAEWAKDKTRGEIRQDYLKWAFAKEEKAGYADEEQKREVEDAYRKDLDEKPADK